MWQRRNMKGVTVEEKNLTIQGCITLHRRLALCLHRNAVARIESNNLRVSSRGLYHHHTTCTLASQSTSKPSEALYLLTFAHISIALYLEQPPTVVSSEFRVFPPCFIVSPKCLLPAEKVPQLCTKQKYAAINLHPDDQSIYCQHICFSIVPH